MIWYALFIPLIITLVGYLLFKHKFAWWELFVGPIICLIIIVSSFYSMKSKALADVEYNGYVIVEARYYEYWSTYVEQTCSYTTCNGTDSKGNCTGYTTHYYDCSYCDTNDAYWVMIDSGGHSIPITEEKYKALIKKWNATPEFNELNRDINTHGGCGQDGNMYSIRWNNRIATSETSTYEKDFVNILKCNHSAFNFPVITESEAKKKGLYNYPKITPSCKQRAVLGLDSIKIPKKNYTLTKLNYLNGKMGASSKVRVFTLFFVDKEIDIAFLQEAYWDGGNQNELVVCIGTDKFGNIKWVKPFSWCDNKRICVDTREDIMNIKKVNVDKMYEIYKTNILKFWHYKSFKDFNYLSFEPTTGQLIFVYVLTTIISLLITIWCIMNGVQEEEN